MQALRGDVKFWPCATTELFSDKREFANFSCTAKLLRDNFMDKNKFAKEDPPLLAEEKNELF